MTLFEESHTSWSKTSKKKKLLSTAISTHRSDCIDLFMRNFKCLLHRRNVMYLYDLPANCFNQFGQTDFLKTVKLGYFLMMIEA